MSTAPIEIERIQDVTIAISEDIKERKESALMASGFITVVDDDASQKDAATAIRDLKSITRSVETARKECKKPFLEKGRELDAIAKEFSESLLSEQKRLTEVMTAYTVEQNRIRQEEERKRREAIQKAEAEKQRAIEEAREAERKRLEKIRLAEEEKQRAEQAIVEAKNKEERLKAEEEKRKSEEAVQEAVADKGATEFAGAMAVESIKEAKEIRKELPKPEAPKGVQVRKELNIYVHDVDALYRTRPDLCRVEPLIAQIKKAIKDGEKLHGVTCETIERPIIR